ncbi:MAG TPA: hypothetical protein VFX55_12870 [Duganella sp.]|nr:hypothetical protein [Duganella sp.]
MMASAAFCPGVLAPLLCLLMGALGWLVGRSAAIARQLDISGVGLVRLAVYQHNGVPQRVLAGSTFWPRLLVLRLGDADGGEQALALLPDSVAPSQWRALAVASRAAARIQINMPAV